MPGTDGCCCWGKRSLFENNDKNKGLIGWWHFEKIYKENRTIDVGSQKIGRRVCRSKKYRLKACCLSCCPVLGADGSVRDGVSGCRCWRRYQFVLMSVRVGNRFDNGIEKT